MRDFEQVLIDSDVPTTEEAITEKFNEVLADSGSTISNDSNYSPFWRIVSALATKPVLWLVSALITNVFPEFFLKTVGESFISIFGDEYGCERKEAQFLQGRVVFSRTETEEEYTIPASTEVYTDSLNGTVYKYLTDEEIVMSVGESSVIVAVTSESASSYYNLEAGYIKYCDLDGVTVVNPDNWIDQLGAEQEELETYRLRIKSCFNTLSHYHTDGVYKYLVTSWVGVDEDNIYFQYNTRGAGTADIYILFDTVAPAESYLETINRMITGEGYHGVGDDVVAFEMPEVEYNIVSTLYFSDELMLEEKAAKKTEVYNIIYAAFRGNSSYEVTTVAPYSRFSFSKLAGEVYELIDGIEDIEFNLNSIVSELSVPVLSSLTIK